MAEYDAPTVHDDDLLGDEEEFNPAANELKDSTAWLNLLKESEKAFKDWNDHCDNIDKLYSNLTRLANNTRDKQFQMFWANCEVMRPSIFSKAPVPVVVPKFKDRRPLYQTASEVLERDIQVSFDITRIADVMKTIRDDLAIVGRGVAWCRYEGGKGKKYGHGYGAGEKVCIDYKHRKDFRHSVSRCWSEVSWVAAASYLTRPEARKRFYKHSGDEYQSAEYEVQKDDKEIGGGDDRQRAAFWEIWHKGLQRVVWVSEGCEKILDEDEPHLSLTNFFPCPQPVYATCQRGSLVPVPDVMFYRDQLEEVNLLTAKIHALSSALAVKGFYPAGGSGGEIGEAVETAMKTNSTSTVMVPISNWASFGNTKDVILWMPIDMIATTITALVTLRKQVIEDIYQIIGLADIMRGASSPEETLGAQQIKTQYGSVRIRDKQNEMVRMSRDLVEIFADIISGEYSKETIMDMCQLEIPSAQQIKLQMKQLEQQVQAQVQEMQQMMQSPQGQQVVQQAQQNPQAVAQVGQMAQQHLEAANKMFKELSEKPTQEAVVQFLRDNKARMFILDIETDSTIQPDEIQEKKQRAEYMQALSLLLPQLSAMVMAEPATATFAGELLKFSMAPYKVGRQLDGVLDEFVEQIKLKGNQPAQDPKAGELKAFSEVEMAKLAQKDKELEHTKQKDFAELQYKIRKDAEDRKARAIELQIDEQSEILHAQQGAKTEQMKERQGWVKIQQDAQSHQQKMAQMAEQTRSKQQQEMIKIDGKQREMAMKERVEAVKAQTAAAVGAAKVQQAQAAPVGGEGQGL